MPTSAPSTTTRHHPSTHPDDTFGTKDFEVFGDISWQSLFFYDHVHKFFMTLANTKMTSPSLCHFLGGTAISLSGLHIHFFMPLPHFYPTMAYCKTTMTIFFLIMAQIYVFGTFCNPIKRVTLFRHVLWTQIWGKVML